MMQFDGLPSRFRENVSHACLRPKDRQVSFDAASILAVLRCYVHVSVASEPVPDVTGSPLSLMRSIECLTV